jgi:O-antigen ligase
LDAASLLECDPVRLQHEVNSLNGIFRIVDRAGHYGAGIFAFGSFFGAGVANIGLALMLLSMLGVRDASTRALVRTQVFRLTVLLGAIILFRAALAVWEEPVAAEEHWSEARRWAMLILFVPFGYWLARWADAVLTALLLALSGLLLSAVLSLDWSTLQLVFQGGRYGFGFSEVPWGMYSAVATLGLIVFGGRLLLRRGRTALVLSSTWLLALAFFLQGLLASQSRGAWVAFAAALPISLMILVFGRLASPVRWRRWGTAAAVALAGAAIMVANQKAIIDRLDDERDVVAAIIKGDFEDMPLSSVGLRVRATELALEAVRERPVTGLGPAGTRHVLASASDAGVRGLSHLHNGYLEILVRFGLLGSAAFGALIAAVLGGLWRGYRRGSIAPDYLAFFVGAFLLAAIWSMIDFRLIYSDGRFFWILMMGAGWSLVLKSDRQAPTTITSQDNAADTGASHLGRP